MKIYETKNLVHLQNGRVFSLFIFVIVVSDGVI